MTKRGDNEEERKETKQKAINGETDYGIDVIAQSIGSHLDRDK